MATWNDVKSYLESNYEVVEDKGSLLIINVATTPGRSQLMFVGGGEAALSFKSPVAKIGSVQPGKILELAEMFGASTMGDFYCFSHLALMQTLDTLELDVPMNLLAEAADKAEAALGLADKL